MRLAYFVITPNEQQTSPTPACKQHPCTIYEEPYCVVSEAFSHARVQMGVVEGANGHAGCGRIAVQV